MGFTDTLKSNLGFIPKAILEFEDSRALAKKVERKAAEIKADSSFNPGTTDPTKVQEAANKKAAAALGLATPYHKKHEGTKYLRYEVLFNPKELTLNGHGEAMVLMHDKSDGKGLSYRVRKANLEANIPLIVDRTLASKIQSGVDIPGVNTSLSGGAMALANNFRDGSIQQEVEAFIAVLQSQYTKRVVFYWGDMVFDGILSSVNAQYQIFDPNGNPTRATIQLHLILASADFPVQVWDGEREGPWMKYYKGAFSEAFNSGVKGSQFGSNILNL